MKSRKIIIFIPFILLLHHCLKNQSHDIQAPETPTYSVQIQLQNIDSGKPVPNTKMIMWGDPQLLLFEAEKNWVETTADSTGIYLFENLVPGVWEFRIFEQDCYITTVSVMIVRQDTSLAVKIPQALITRERFKRPGGSREKWFEAGICWKAPGVCATIGTWKVSDDAKNSYSRLFEGDFADGFAVMGDHVFEEENPDFSGLAWAAPNYYTFSGTLDNPQICILDRKTGKVAGRGKAPHRLIDLTWDGKNFWGTTTHSKIVQFSRYSFALKSEYPAPDSHPGGIAWDGQNLWSYDTETRWIYKHGKGLHPIRTFCLVYQDDYYENWTLHAIKYMAFDFANNLYILDPAGGYYVYKFTVPGN